ncbi:anthrone oxygenase family protein [Paenibacillus sp. FSL W8-1287]|uniref:anthrone oxygenase family protein n=1 Tax=Paenibacillus sp. FSL W8-1287 TaxID=2954653 RepID=UPI0030D58968
MHLLGASLLYLAGFIVTIAFNVPLNDALATVDPEPAPVLRCGTPISEAGRRGTM